MLQNRLCGALLLLLLLTLLSPGRALAQPTAGLKVGGNAAFLLNPKPLAHTSEAKPGVVGGVFLSLPLGERIAIQPEVQYSQLGTRFKHDASGNSAFTLPSPRDRLFLDEVTVPLLLKVFLVKRKVHLHAGPQFGFVLRAEEERTNGGVTTKTDVSDLYRSTDYGIVAGIGANLPLRLTLDLRYVAGVADMIADSRLVAQRALNNEGKLNQHALQLLLGVRIY